MQKKIAIFLPSLAGGGAEKVMLDLAERLSSDTCQVDLLVANKQGPCKLSPCTKVHLIDLNAGKPSRAIFKLIKYIWREKPYAIMSALTHANIALAIAHKLSLGAQRCILNERADALALTKEKYGADRLMTKWAGKICYPWAHEIIAVSAGTADSIAKLFALKREKIKVIYNLINLDNVLTQSKAPAELPWKDELPIIISAGRLSTQKNYPLLIAAFHQVRKQIPCHLAILGEGEERDSIENLVASLNIQDDVWMPGYVGNSQAYISRAKIFILASNYEGLPNVLIESLALNIPIISTNCPSGPAEILCNGRYGILVEPGNIQQLTNAILNALSGEHPKFSNLEAISRFDPKTILAEYKKVLGIDTI